MPAYCLKSVSPHYKKFVLFMSPNINFGILSLFFGYLCHSFNPDPLQRHTFWTIIVGGSVMWVSIYSINQSQVQRFISCKTLGHAKM